MDTLKDLSRKCEGLRIRNNTFLPKLCVTAFIVIAVIFIVDASLQAADTKLVGMWAAGSAKRVDGYLIFEPNGKVRVYINVDQNEDEIELNYHIIGNLVLLTGQSGQFATMELHDGVLVSPEFKMRFYRILMDKNNKPCGFDFKEANDC